MTRQVILNADDFGWTDGHNLAVEKAHLQGVLHRASLMCTGDAFFEAVELTQRLPKLLVGVHLTLNEGRSLLGYSLLPNVTQRNGCFYDKVLDLSRLWIMGRLQKKEVSDEWRAQIERVLAAGITPSHLDSHKHVHLFPPLMEAIIQVAQEMKIKYIRLPLERDFKHMFRRGLSGILLWILAVHAKRKLILAGMNFSDHFVGVGYSGEMTASRLKNTLANTAEGLTEIMVHPAVVTSSVMALKKRYKWAARYCFAEEFEALCLLKPSDFGTVSEPQVCF